MSPEGVRRRRHIKTVGREVTRLDDEVLDLAAAGQSGPTSGLNGEAALLAALNASRTGQMTDIVETIQVEQDWIIRAPHKGVLVVQGGPGTGKTAVALHRAAFLLYTHREQLARRVVLVIGPVRRSCVMWGRCCRRWGRPRCCCPRSRTCTRASPRGARSRCPPRG